MGFCSEFGLVLEPACGHAMVPRVGDCQCSECATTCSGRFLGCAAVWARGPQPITLRHSVEPAREADSEDPGTLALESVCAQIRLFDTRLHEVVTSKEGAADLQAVVDVLSSQIKLLPDRLAAVLSRVMHREHEILMKRISDALKASGFV